jgi:hypothetical protein
LTLSPVDRVVQACVKIIEHSVETTASRVAK